MSAPAGPFTTSICSRLNTSRLIEPTSRMPSTKMLVWVSNPRMKMASPVCVLPFSPIWKVIPGVLRSASLSVVAPCSCSSSFLMTVMVCGVSTSGCVSFGDDETSAL